MFSLELRRILPLSNPGTSEGRREVTRRMERAELLDRLCDLRDAYKRRGPDDREASVTMDSLLDHLAKTGDHAQLMSAIGPVVLGA